MQIKRSIKFKKQYQKLPKNIQKKFKDRVRMLLQDFYNPLLNNHKLTGNYKGYYSINITGDYRVVFYYSKEVVLEFIAIGKHSELYG